MSTLSLPVSLFASKARSICSVIYWLVILLSVVDYGGSGTKTVPILCLGIFALLPMMLATTGLPKYSRSVIIGTAIVLIAILGFITFQTSPLPGHMLSHPAWQEVVKLNPDTVPVISLTPADDMGGFLKIALCAGIFMLGLMLYDTDERALSALKIIGIGGGIIAIWSILQFLLLPGTLGFGQKKFYLDSLTSFFINRNTAGTFLGLLLLALFTLAWRTLEPLEIRHIWGRITYGTGLTDNQKKQLLHTGFYTLLLFGAFVALMLTRSRGATAATFISLMMLAVMLVFGSKKSSATSFARPTLWTRIRPFALTGAAMFMVMIMFSAFAGRASLRIEAAGGEDGRFCVMPFIKSAVADHLPWGSGLSSFQSVYAGYHEATCGIARVWTRAHNVYMEGLLTLGVVFAILVAIFVVAFATIFIRGIFKRKNYGFAPKLGLAAIVLVAIHSAIDFSVQIPGMATSFAALLAPLVTISLRPSAGRRKRQSRSS